MEVISTPLPVRSDSSLDVLEIIKVATSRLNANIIHQGSLRAYKNSKHLRVGSKYAVSVPRESVYDAEVYRILVNWLTYEHDIEITSQWHLESIGEDGYYHHSYCDLTLKLPHEERPVAVIELLATASHSTLERHFKQIFSYAKQLQPKEIWIIHFTREDDILSNSYWPKKELMKKGLNIVQYWHDERFENVRMSAKYQSLTGKTKTIKNLQILP